MHVHDDVIVKIVSMICIPVIFLFGIYIFLHGEISPGGAFQSGAIFASAIIVYCLTHGTAKFLKIMPTKFIEKMSVIGVSTYVVIGIICIMLGGNFLEYKVLFKDHHLAQSFGIIGIELGVVITVTSVLTYIFLTFTSNKQ